MRIIRLEVFRVVVVRIITAHRRPSLQPLAFLYRRAQRGASVCFSTCDHR